MRRAIQAFVMVAVVTAAAPPAGAVDDGFQGRYRVVARLQGQNAINLGCDLGKYSNRIYVTFVNARVRQFGDSSRGLPVPDSRLFRYRPGEAFPWRHTGGVKYMLQYHPATDTAVGTREAHHCAWNLRLYPIHFG